MTRKLRGRRGGASAGQVVEYAGARLAPYAAPWLVWLVLPLVAVVLRALGNNGTGAGIAVGATVGAAALVLVAFTWHVFRARGESIQRHAVVFAAACLLWLLVATAAGLFATPDVRVSLRYWYRAVPWLVDAFNWPWAVWLLAMLVSSVSWNIRRVSAGEGRDDHAGGDSGFLAKVGLAAKPRGAVTVEADGARVRLPVRMLDGTADDVERARGEIAARAGVRLAGVRVEKHSDRNHADADIVVTPRDLLAATRHWQGPKAPGESIALPVEASIAEDGEPGRLYLAGDRKAGKPMAHVRVGGMTGAGKTEFALTVYGEALPREGVSLCWFDYVKGVQSVEPIAAGCAMVLTEKAPAVTAFRRIPEVIRSRTATLGRAGFKEWTPEAYRKTGLKFLILHFEESADMLAGSQLIVKLSEQARSAGVLLVLSQQRWTHDRIPTSARSNFGTGLTFGVEREEEAEWSLSDETRDAGASPWVWKAEKPGYHYAEIPGTPRARWAVPHRAELADPEHLREVMREHCQAPGLDHITARAFGQVYTDYRRQVIEGAAAWQTTDAGVMIPVGVDVPRPRAAEQTTPAAAGGSEEQPMEDPRGDQVDGFDDVDDVDELPEPAGVVAFGAGAGADEDDDQDDVDEDDDDDVDGAFVRRQQPEPGFMDVIDARQPLDDEEDDGLPLGEPAAAAPEIGPTEARERLREELRRQADAGKETVRPRDLVAFRQSLPRSPGWLVEELQRLVADGFLTAHPDRGVYGLPARVPA